MVLAVVDLVLIMSVNPGFGGQSFIESQVKKISDLRRLCAEKVCCNHFCFFMCWLIGFVFLAWILFLHNLSHSLSPQGVNPWIEVDGGVGPANAYKVRYSLSHFLPFIYI